MRSRCRLVAAAIVIVPAILAGCESDGVNLIPPPSALVAMEDQCDSASFNAALGPGTCIRGGAVTYAAFSAALALNGRVATWQFVPGALLIRLGQQIRAVNTGGEEHTFTRVAFYGGGVVPALNGASGNPVITPECALLLGTDRVPPGGSATTNAAARTGTDRYQCCIHPWMRTTVTVTP